MRVLWRWFKRIVTVILIGTIFLLAPIAYVELGCRGGGEIQSFEPRLAAEHHRPETRTFLTYPEWHIVHAYEDYAEVIRIEAPHNFGYLSSIGGFWSSLCALSKTATAHGPVDGGTKQMVYVIGASFTVELLFKAAYEETLGRLFVILRGQDRSLLDDVSANQAKAYADFLQQTPWYKWRFREDAAQLSDVASGNLRDRERSIALGLEYKAKAAYADVIAQAVAAVGNDALRLRMIVDGELSEYEDVQVIERTPFGTIVETPRYRELTHLLMQMAQDGIRFVEIAGNDDILLTMISPDPTYPNSIYSAQRQGFNDYRHLVVFKVSALAEGLRQIEQSAAKLEHIHDY